MTNVLRLFEDEERVSRTGVRIEDVTNEGTLIHAVEITWVAVLNQIELLILRAFADAMVHEDHLLPTERLESRRLQSKSRTHREVSVGNCS